MTTVDLLLILAGLQIKHFAADYLLQTAEMRKDKGLYGNPRGLWHAFIHVAGSALFLLPCFGFGVAIVAVLFGEGVAHYHIDWAKEQIGRRLRLGMQSRGFWRLFGLDQLAHQITYLAMLLVLLK